MVASAGKPDKRRQKRVRRKVRVVLHADGQRIKGTTADLSTGGMLVTCAHLLIPGTKLHGELFLREEEALPFEAQVRWSRNSTRWMSSEIQHSMGLEFIRPLGATYQAFLETPVKATLSVADVRAHTKLPPIKGAIHGRQEGKIPPRPLPPLTRRTPPAPPPPPTTATVSARFTPVPSHPIVTPPPQPLPPPPPEPVERTDVIAIPEENPFTEVTPGLTGVAHGSARSAHQKTDEGKSPLAPSTAASLVERAAVRAVTAHLPKGYRTVGLAIDLELRKPPLVMLGAALEGHAKLLRLQPDRTLVFSCEVRQNDQVIASGRHQRLIVEVSE